MPLFSEGVPLPDFFQVATREIIQISSATQIPYSVHLPRETPDDLRPSQMFYVMTVNDQNECHFGVLDVQYRCALLSMNVQGVIELEYMSNATSDPLRLHYTNIFANDKIIGDLQDQIQKRHFRGVDSSAGGVFFDMRLLGGFILNQQVRETWKGKMALKGRFQEPMVIYVLGVIYTSTLLHVDLEEHPECRTALDLQARHRGHSVSTRATCPKFLAWCEAQLRCTTACQGTC